MRPIRRCTTRIFFLSLLTVSVFIPLVLLSHRLKHLDTDVSKDSVEDLSILKGRIEYLALKAVEEEGRASLKEPSLNVYKDLGLNSGVTLNSLDEDDRISESGNATVDRNILEINGTYNDQKDEFNRKENTTLLEGNGTSDDKKDDTQNKKDILHSQQEGKKAITLEKEQFKQAIAESELHPQSNRASDERVKEIKDQIIRAKAYLKFSPPTSNSHFVKELKYRIKELQRIVGDSTKDSDLPRRALQKMKAMEASLAKADRIYPDCSAMAKKLRAMAYNSEEQVRANKNQRTYLLQLAGRTTPKGLHCLSMRLTSEFFSLQPEEREPPNQHKLHDATLYHIAIFSDNVLACAVVVNSTITSASDSKKLVFHIVTDSLNLPAITMWFILNPPGKAAIEIQSLDNFGWLAVKYDGNLQKQDSLDPRFTSPLNHLRFYLPDIFPRLNKIVLLDHDVVVQKDLLGLWKINMKGKVIGAVETCRKGEASSPRMDKLINFSDPIIAKRFDPNACTWAFGMNIFDLQQWRRRELTGVYHKYLLLGSQRPLMKGGSLPIGWMTFYRQTVALDRRWHVLGLGYESGVKPGDITRSAVIHFDGIMKPWLDIGLDKYKGYWKKYVNYQLPHLEQCNIHG